MMIEVGRDLTLESCATQALALVTELNHRGVYANIKLDDNALHLLMPAYGDTEPSQTVIHDECEVEECEKFLEVLQRALDYFIANDVRGQRLTQIIDNMSIEDIKAMADILDVLPREDIQLLIGDSLLETRLRTAIIRRTGKDVNESLES